jgi:hypothetical protein
MTLSTVRPSKLIRMLALCALALTASLRTAHAADDTARFLGSWTASAPVGGQMVTILSVHDTTGYRNFVVATTGNVSAGSGSFSAANGKYATSADAPNNAGNLSLPRQRHRDLR